MTEERNALTDLFAACWKDDALKARFMADPKGGACRAYGMDDALMGIECEGGGERRHHCVYITMPALTQQTAWCSRMMS